MTIGAVARLGRGAARWLRAADRGSPAFEMGAVASIMLILIGGVLEFGLVLFQIMQVDNALEGGLAYAAGHGNSYSSATIAAAVDAATGLQGIAATPAPLTFCACASSSGLTCAGSTATISDHGASCAGQYPGNCGSGCLSGFSPGTYVSVAAQVNLPPGFDRIPGLPSLLQAVGTVRTK